MMVPEDDDDDDEVSFRFIMMMNEKGMKVNF